MGCKKACFATVAMVATISSVISSKSELTHLHSMMAALGGHFLHCTPGQNMLHTSAYQSTPGLRDQGVYPITPEIQLGSPVVVTTHLVEDEQDTGAELGWGGREGRGRAP